MRIRALLTFTAVLLLVPALSAQSTTGNALPNAPSFAVAHQISGPIEVPTALPQYPAGESSSRRHSDKVNTANGAPDAKDALPTTAAEQQPCQEPAKLFSAKDYSGPLSRLGAWFSRKPELSTVPTRHHGSTVCSMSAGDKFGLFFHSTVEPMTVLGAAATAGFSQWADDDREWGQGAEGYGMRFGAALTDKVNRNFFSKFFYPTVFRQDPRYYRSGEGSTGHRMGHALVHTFVARGDSGKNMPNISLWASAASTSALKNLYHPGRDRGFGSTAVNAGTQIGTSAAMDILKEFWPDIVRKFKLPFRERHVGTPPPDVTP